MKSPYSELLELVRSAYTDYEIIEELDRSSASAFAESYFDPEDIYSRKVLEEWAEDNGFVKE